MAATDEAADWVRGLDELVEQIAPRFRRVEPRRRVRAYLQGAYLQGAYLQGAYLQGLLAPRAQERLAAGRARGRPYA